MKCCGCLTVFACLVGIACFGVCTHFCTKALKESFLECPGSGQQCPNYYNPTAEVVRYRGPCEGKGVDAQEENCEMLGCVSGECAKGLVACNGSTGFTPLSCVQAVVVEYHWCYMLNPGRPNWLMLVWLLCLIVALIDAFVCFLVTDEKRDEIKSMLSLFYMGLVRLWRRCRHCRIVCEEPVVPGNAPMQYELTVNKFAS